MAPPRSGQRHGGAEPPGLTCWGLWVLAGLVRQALAGVEGVWSLAGPASLHSGHSGLGAAAQPQAFPDGAGRKQGWLGQAGPRQPLSFPSVLAWSLGLSGCPNLSPLAPCLSERGGPLESTSPHTRVSALRS